VFWEEEGGDEERGWVLEEERERESRGGRGGERALAS
jgi:hypothetical protein